MKLTILVFVLLATAFPHLVAAEPEWQGHTGQWCLVQDTSRMCLPKDFQVKSLGAFGADFELEDPGDEPNVYVKFRYLNTPDEGESLDLADVYVRERSEMIGDLSFTEYSIDPAQISMPGVDAFVVEVKGSFAVLLVASNNRGVEELARALTNEWIAKTRVPSKLGNP